MAGGNKLGNVFVEMGLDSTQFTKAQVEILNASTKTALESEKNFRTLGTQSDLIFKTMKENIQSSLGAIVNSSKSSKDEIVRAEQAAADKIKQINDQQFGKQTSMLDTLKANWIAASVAIAAAFMVAGKAMEYIELGAKAQQAEDSFRRVAATAGESADGIIAAMKRATAGTVDDSDLMQRAVKGMILGLSADTMVQIAEMARLGARVSGQSVAEAIEGITNSIATGMPKALKQYGLALGPEVAIITAAQKAGVEGINLMTLATLNYNIELARHGELQDNASEAIQRFKAQVIEAKETVGKMLIEALLPMIPAITTLATLFGGVLYAALWAVSGVVKIIWTGFQALAAIAMETAALVIRGFETLVQGVATVQEAFGFKEAAAGTRAFAAGLNKTWTDLQGAALQTTDDITKAWVSSDKTNLASATGTNTAKIAAEEAAKKAELDRIKALTAAKKDAAKIAKDLVTAEMTDIKSFYDRAIAADNNWLMVQRDNGANELDTITEYYDKKNDDLWTYYDNEWQAIQKSKIRESEKQVLYTKLNKEYYDIADKNLNELTKNEIAAANKNITVMAGAYKTINQYSDESVAAEIANIEREYKEKGRYVKAGTDEEIALNKAKAQEIQNIDSKTEQAKLAMYGKVGIYASDSAALIESLAIDEYNKIIDLTNNETLAEKAYRDFKIDANLKMAASSNDFFAGFKAQLADAQQKQYTWGQAGIDVAKGMTSAMQSTFSSFFQDVFRGDLKTAGDYFSAFATSMEKAFADVLAKMVADWATAKITAFAGEALNTAGSWLWDLADSWAEGTMNLKGDGSSGGAIPIIAHEGEMIIPKALAKEIRDYLGGSGSGLPIGAGWSATAVTGVAGLIGSYFGGKVGSWLGGQFGETGGAIGGVVGNVAGGYYGAEAGAYLADLLGLVGTTGLEVTAVEGGFMITSAYAPTVFMSAADAAAAGVGSTGAMASIYEALGITAAEAGPIGVAVAANIAFILKGIELAYDMGRAGFGSGTHEAIDTGIYGGLPDVTKGWFQMPGSSQPAPLGLITGFEKGIVDMVKNTYGMVDKALNPLDAAVATRARAALATMNIDYMPDYPGLVSGTNIDLTRETTRGALIQQAVYEGNLETGTYHETTPQIIVDTTADYLLKISPYILGQIAPVLEAAQAQQNAIYGSSDTMKVGGSSFDEGWGVPHKTGLDFVPFDNYPARLHKGERVQTASERSDLVEEFRALREEMKVNLYAITKNTAKVAKTTDRWDQDGMPPDRNGITAKWDTEGLPPERP